MTLSKSEKCFVSKFLIFLGLTFLILDNVSSIFKLYVNLKKNIYLDDDDLLYCNFFHLHPCIFHYLN